MEQRYKKDQSIENMVAWLLPKKKTFSLINKSRAINKTTNKRLSYDYSFYILCRKRATGETTRAPQIYYRAQSLCTNIVESYVAKL